MESVKEVETRLTLSRIIEKFGIQGSIKNVRIEHVPLIGEDPHALITSDTLLVLTMTVLKKQGEK